MAGCLAIASFAAQAQSRAPVEAWLDSPFIIQFGGFNLVSGIEGKVNGQSTQNPEINFDEAFGRGSAATRARIDALWRITDRHHARVQFFNNRNLRTRVLAEDLAFGDFVFLAGSSATLRDESQVLQVAYEYAWHRSPQLELAAMLGVHATNVSLQVSGVANTIDANGNVTSTGAASRVAEALAPMPVVGVRAAWAASPSWLLEGHAQVFSLKAKDARGTWANLRIGSTWMFNRHLGFGVGYDLFGTRLEVDKPDFDGRLRLGYRGIQTYINGTY